jgi:hypothetical protein
LSRKSTALGSNNRGHDQSRSDECGSKESQNISHLWILASHEESRVLMAFGHPYARNAWGSK